MSQAAERRLSYDKNLLREAEAVMQEQLRPNRSGFASSSQTRLAHLPQLPASNDHFHSGEKATRMPSGTGLPFWRTTKGIVLIAVGVIVIIGAIVGAAVGTSTHKAQSATSTVTPITPSSAPSAATSSIGASVFTPPGNSSGQPI